ncbi:MAG: extracellular solute-binding protein [Clostridia bacterium]|nr:extracellular solute-binding protein [Clostridia bacterium]
MKRILSLLLVLSMLLSLGLVNASAEAQFVDGKFTEPVTITVEIYNRSNDGGTDPTNNKFTDYIKKGMLDKYNVVVEYVSVPRWTEVDEINNLLASGDAPDVCVTYSYPTIQTYASMGGVLDLAPYLTEHKDKLTNLFNLLGDYNIYYDQDPTTGELWAIEALLAERARINLFVREDWLAKLNLAVPTTLQEFEDMLVAFQNNAELLLGEDADRMIPYTTSYDIGWRNDHLLTSFVPDAATDDELYVNGFDDRHLLYPGYKEGVRVLNKWYNMGLIWKDFALYGSGDTTEDSYIKAGFVGAFMHNWDYPYRNGEESIIANLKRNVSEDANYIAIECFQNDAGVYRKFLADSVDRKVFFPYTNDQPLASLLYLDFISSPETVVYLQTGDEGVNHVVTENGAIQTVAATAPDIMNSGMNIDYTITINGLQLFDAELTGKSKALNYAGIDADDVVQALAASTNGGRTVAHYNVGAITAEEGIGTSLSEKRDAFLCRAIVASVADFDKIYDEGMADYLASGGQDIIDERAEKIGYTK